MANWEQPHWSGRAPPPVRRAPIKPNVFALTARFSARHRFVVLSVFVLLALLSAAYAASRLTAAPDVLPLVTLDARTAAANGALQSNFPGIDSTIIAVVSGDGKGLGREVATDVATLLGSRGDLFASAFVPGTGAFYTRNGLLFLPTEDIEARVGNLVLKQPLYLAIAAAPDLQGLASLIAEIGRAVEQGRSPPGLTGLLEAVAEVIEADVAGDPRALDWLELAGLEPGNGGGTWYVIALPVPGMEDAAAAFALSLSQDQADIAWLFPAANQGEGNPGLKSFAVPLGLAALVAVTLLAAGIGSARRAVPLVLCAAVVVALSAAAAALINPRLDGVTWSFAAAVLAPALLLAAPLIVAYGHARLRDASVRHAIMLASQRRGLMQCAVAMIFSVFWLTWLMRRIPSLAEFSVIALIGTGIALIAAVTLVPAALAAFDRDDLPVAPHWFDLAVAMPAGNGLRNALQFGGMILLAAGLFCSIFLPSVKFGERTSGYDPPQQLQTPDARGAIHVLTQPGDAAREMVASISALPEVGAIRWAELLLPPDLDGKIAALRQLEGHLPVSPQARAEGQMPELAAVIGSLQAGLQKIADGAAADDALRQAALRLRQAVERFAAPDLPSPERVKALDDRLFQGMDTMVATASALVTLRKPTLEDVDAPLRERFVSRSGVWRIEVMPKPEVSSVAFAAALRKVAPDSAGEPVLVLTRNEIMHHEAAVAFASAVAAALVLAFVVLRDAVRWFVALPAIVLFFTFAAAALAIMGLAVSAAMLAALSCGAAVAAACAVLMAERTPLAEAAADPRDGSVRAILLPLLMLIGIVAPLTLSAYQSVADYGLAGIVYLAIVLGLVLILIPSLGQWFSQYFPRRR